MSFKEYWGRQFGYPRGLGGRIAVIIMNRINRKMNKTILDNIPVDGEILDIGFGGGNTLKLLLKKTDAKIYGIDISKDMIKLATKKNKRAIKNSRLFLKEGTVDNIAFEQDFDTIYTSNTIYFWKDLKKGMISIKSKLKNGGLFLNVFRTKEWLDRLEYTKFGYAKYKLEEVVEITKDLGFAVKIIEIGKGTYAIMAIK